MFVVCVAFLQKLLECKASPSGIQFSYEEAVGSAGPHKTPLFVAASFGANSSAAPELMRLLLAAKANPNDKDEPNAASFVMPLLNPACLELLVEAGLKLEGTKLV